MKLFYKYEAVRFPEENLIFITNDSYIYYIYNPKYKYWKKYRNAGNDSITINNYQEVSREELIEAVGGVFPTKETDILRLCYPDQLNSFEMIRLLREDYPYYMNNSLIEDTVYWVLKKSDIRHRSYSELQKLFDNANKLQMDNDLIIKKIVDLSFAEIGRDIFKREIEIIDGHDYSSYFWFKPVRVIDYTNTHDWNTVAEMDSAEISIQENDVHQYLTPFLYKYFDGELEANKNRLIHTDIDIDGNEESIYSNCFEWNLTHNFYTFESMKALLKDMSNTVDALSAKKENEFTAELREERGTSHGQLIYARNLTNEQIKEYNSKKAIENSSDIEMIVDFYQRFIYRMEYMIRIGEEKGYNHISVMGP